METSKDFIAVIDNYLLQKAEKDPEFKSVFQKPEKNVNQCINYTIIE